MAVNRYKNQNPDQNAAALTKVLQDPMLTRLILFVSPGDGGSSSDGPDTNYPLLSALAELEGENGELAVKVFDGLFLTVARPERYNEVLPLLDIAQTKPYVYYGTRPLNFTSHLPEEEAASEMANHPYERFDSASRPDFFKLLSPYLTEKALANF